MTITIILITVVLSVLIASKLPAKRRKATIVPSSFDDLEKEEDKVPIYHEFRRVQQVLARKGKVVEDQIREIGLGKQELAIGNLMLALGNKHIEIKDDIIKADEKALDTTKREIEAIVKWNEADLKEKANQLTLDKIELKGKENEIMKKFGLFEIEEGRLKLREQELDLKDLMGEIIQRNNLVDLKEEGIKLKWQELDLGKIQNEIQNDLKQIELGKEGLKLQDTGLDLKDKWNKIENHLLLIDLNRKDLDLVKKELGIEEAMNNIKEKLGLIRVAEEGLKSTKREIGLDRKEVLLERFHNRNLKELSDIANGKKEIEIGRRELKLLHQIKAHELETTIQRIKHMYTDLRLEQKAWKNERKEDMLKLYRQELTNLDRYIHQMYDVKMNWLRIQERENKISYREDKLALQDLYDRTMSKIESLKLTRWENDLVLREDEVNRKKSTLGYIRNLWLN